MTANIQKTLNQELAAEGDIDDDFLSIFEQETGWRSVLLYQFLSGYSIMIAISCLVTFGLALIELSFLWADPDPPELRHSQIFNGNSSFKNQNFQVAPYCIASGALTFIFAGIMYMIDAMYLVDVIFRICYNRVQWSNMKLYYEPAPIECILADVLSLLPIEVIYVMVKRPRKPLTVAMYRMRVLFRMYRVPATLNHLSSMFYRTSAITVVFWASAGMILNILLMASFSYAMLCSNESSNCTYRDYTIFSLSYAGVMRFVLANGEDVHIDQSRMIHQFGVLAITFLLTGMIIMSVLVCKSIDRLKPIYRFIREYEKTVKLYRQMKKWYHVSWTYEEERVYDTIKDYYSHFRHQRNGVIASRVLDKILPAAMTKHVLIDMSLDSFRHSRLFRNQELNVLRFLSEFVTFEFAVPGELIVRKGEMLNKMIYITHGVLQILSEEDRETGVLNLSGGTCLGETTLFVSYPMSCSILCQFYCELVIIDKAALSKMIEYYPNEYRKLVKDVMRQYDKAKKLRLIASQVTVKSEQLTLAWIKHFQLTMQKGPRSSKLSIEQRLGRVWKHIESMVFYVGCLDKLSVSQEIELVKDKVFLKTSFPFILQPHSPILMVWKILVLSVTIFFIVIYPYNICFPTTNADGQTGYTTFATVIYGLDIYLKLFTAVKTRGATHATVTKILLCRIRQPKFCIDCFAALPIEYFMTFLSSDNTKLQFLLLQSNRLLKYYLIEEIFAKLSIWNTSRMTLCLCLKFVIHFLFFCYYSTLLVYFLNCIDNKCTPEYVEFYEECNAIKSWSRIVATMPVSTSILTGANISSPMPENGDVLVVICIGCITFISCMFRVLFIVEVLSTLAVENQAMLIQQEKMLGIAAVMDWFEVTTPHQILICNYLNTLFHFDAEVYYHFNDVILPTDLLVTFRQLHLMRILKQNAFFGCLSLESLNFLSSCVKFVIIPANMVVFYCGETIGECYTIQNGSCTTWYGQLQQMVSINANLGLVEVLLDIPIYHTIVTSTDCILLKFSKVDLFRCFSRNDSDMKTVYNALEDFAERSKFLCYLIDNELARFFNESVQLMWKWQDYYRRHLTLEMVAQRAFKFKMLSASSKCLLYWEITKAIAWIASMFWSCFMIFMPNVRLSRQILIGLDCFSLLDVLIRFHVCYFNEKGIEVSRVSRTYFHYITHALIIDLVAVAPFDWFASPKNIIIARANRFLQTHRIFGLARHLTKRIRKVHQYSYITYVILFLLVTHNMAAYYIQHFCEIHSDGLHITCDPNSWLALSLGANFTVREAYVETCLYVTSVFFGVGFRKYVNTNYLERSVLSIWGLCGHLGVIIFSGRAASHFMFRNSDLISFQEAMRDLVLFLNYCKIEKNVKHEVVQYFEHVWKKREGKNIADVIGQFPPSVRKSLLYNIYAKRLRANQSIFKTTQDNVLRSYLMIAKQESIRHTGILYKIGDVHERIYFLLHGSVDVVGPDMRCLCTLEPGSMFGCLDNCKECRATLTMVANGHVETLVLTSEEFYKLLAEYPAFHTNFMNAANMHFDYIDANKISYEKKLVQTQHERFKKLFGIRKIKRHIFKPSIATRYIELGLYHFEFWFGSLYELVLQMIVSDMIFWVLAYLRDLLWVLRIYFKFHLAYENEYGKLVTDPKDIRQRYMRHRDGFYFDLFCVLPLDCFTFAIKDNYVRNVWFLVLRLNRFFRGYRLWRNVSRKAHLLNINVFVTRSLLIFMYAYVYTQVKFILYYWLESHLEPIEGTNFERFMNGFEYFNTILLMFAQSPIPYNHFRRGTSLLLSVIITADICFLVFLYSSFAAIMQITSKVKTTYITSCQNLKRMMLIGNASEPIIDNIEKYNKILLRLRNGIQFPNLLERAPFYLREAVLNSMFGFHLTNHYLFKDCHVDFLRQLAAAMRTLMFTEGNEISSKHDLDDTMYFIHEGLVEALAKDNLYAVSCEYVLVAGESFGLDQILYATRKNYYTYRARMVTIVVTLRRCDLVRLLRFYPSAKKHIYNRCAMEYAS